MTIRGALGGLVTIVGLLLVLFSGLALLQPVLVQEFYTAAREAYSDSSLPRLASLAGAPETLKGVAAPGTGEPIGIIEIPRLKLSSVVIEGDEAVALLVGVGHLADTPLPWTDGNSVFAAHRDTFFRPLEHIRRDDIIRFSTRDDEFEYVVTGTKIVAPDAVEVMAPTRSARLTLITCYPFTYIGMAPKRFIVTAERVS
jgi:sortase A